MSKEATKTSVFFGLLAEFGTTQIPLTAVASRYLGMRSEREAKRAAVAQTLPVPAFRVGSQKSDWYVAAEDLAAHIEGRMDEARRSWRAAQGDAA